MFIQRYGVLAQTQTQGARPSKYIECAANGALRTADNSGDPFNFGAKTEKSFSVAGWFNVPIFNAGTSPNKYTEGFFGHGQEFSYMVRMYQSGSTTNTIFYSPYELGSNTGGFVINRWYFIFCTLNDTANTQLFRVYNTSNLIFGLNSSSTSNPVSDTTDYFYLGIPRGRSYWGGTLGAESRFNAVGVWNAALSASDADALWNSGLGLSYANLTSAQKTNLVSYWNCDNYDTNTGVVTDNHTNSYSVTAHDKTKISLKTI